jgi:hypothetical protein
MMCPDTLALSERTSWTTGPLAARYLRQLGHRNFTFLTYRKDLGPAEGIIS